MKCPNCGAEVKRRPMGSGTIVALDSPLAYTESQVYQSMDAAFLDVRGVQNRMANASPPVRKNYHQVQAALSTLVYRKMVDMDTSVFPPRYAKA